MYVKVTMDGAPYPMALEKMFSCFITVILPLICRKLKIMRGSDAVGIAQSGLHKSSSKDRLTNGSKMDALKDLEYVLTYEDKDADWMLGGDLPWDYFTSICQKLKIMRGSYAVGIAPRTIEQTGQNKCAWCLSAPTEDI